MAGLVPGIHVLAVKEVVDGRVKPGHDGVVGLPSHRDTCADTASHWPFCFAQQSV